MNKIRTTIGITALVVSSAACTPEQVAFWMEKQAEVAATPDLTDDIALLNEIEALPETPDTSCSQWYWWAIEAGWTHEQWIYPLSGIMRAESNCSPSAYNRSGASGLLQVMPMWADDCGGTPEDLFDAMFNLICGVHILDVSSWEAWSTFPP